MSEDTGTCGNVLITARIEEHEDYKLFDTTIMAKLSAGISRLQSSAFVFVKTNTGIFEVVPVPYRAALNAPHPFLRRRPFFRSTENHNEFVFPDTDPDTNWTIKESSLSIGASCDKPLTFSNFNWVYSDENGVEHHDCVEFVQPILWESIVSIHCLPTVVLGIGDIP